MSKLGIKLGIGFDIAENMVQFAQASADSLGYPCTFVATDILNIDEKYQHQFDLIVVTIGALPWFQDLNPFFEKVSACLKQDGLLLVHEAHPVTGMIALEGEDHYTEDYPANLAYSYFKKEPWIETQGMGYMNDDSQSFSETFTSFSHPLSEVITACVSHQLNLVKLEEYDVDISDGFGHLDHLGIPLSYILVAKKI